MTTPTSKRTQVLGSGAGVVGPPPAGMSKSMEPDSIVPLVPERSCMSTRSAVNAPVTPPSETVPDRTIVGVKKPVRVKDSVVVTQSVHENAVVPTDPVSLVPKKKNELISPVLSVVLPSVRVKELPDSVHVPPARLKVSAKAAPGTSKSANALNWRIRLSIVS